ncbi:unnamed protein product [Effrenium voratum]|uniref:Transmembrane protein n=1 Tax=Effrenium voratum TaxID=2562239 RepID=A0AA36HTY5_9DINO|nr:unnamed protein product [Effrenium voratum]CAJ1419800.1 unnamed protein product [Effrenium voratum]
MISRRGMSPETIGAENVDVEAPDQSAPLTAAPKSDCILRCCHCISVIDILVLALAAVASVIAIVSSIRPESFNIAAIGLRGASVGLCVLLGIEQGTRNTSCHCSCLRRLFPPLDYWVGRGLAHLFLALQMEGASSEGLDGTTTDLINAASIAVAVVGVFFTSGAFLCFGPLERRHHRLATRKEEVMRELSELERKKKALENEAGM